MAITLTCQHCSHEQEISDNQASADIPCEVCHHSINPTANSDAGIQAGPAPNKFGGSKSPTPENADRSLPGRRSRNNGSESSFTTIWVLLGGGVFLILVILCGAGGIGAFLLVGLTAKNEAVIAEKQAREIGLNPDMALAAPPARADERIQNGDFEQGNKGFRTDYTHSPGNIRPEVSYDIVKSPQDVHAEAGVFGDRTSGKGYMMVVNGGNAPQQLVWGQTADVRPGADYTFSLWAASWTPFSPAELEIRVNGKSIGQFSAPGNVGEWRELKIQWKAGEAKTAVIEIYDLNQAVSGNDFALDDISLRGPAPSR